MWNITRPSLVKSILQRRSVNNLSTARSQKHWLLSKKNEELRQAAIACGSVCSGTKQLLADGLENALSEHDAEDSASGRDLSIVSIDMGIRNLAYCHLGARLEPINAADFQRQTTVKVDAWRRIDMTGNDGKVLGKDYPTHTAKGRRSKHQAVAGPTNSVEEQVITPTKEDFSPNVYAERAYKFVTDVLQKHQPTHVLIERQRFRSGGGPAVQEWTLRVGMFEFMLYATIRTLAEQGVHDAAVVAMQPPMVNRYWLSRDESASVLEVKPTSAAMKKYKIDQVSRMLEKADAKDPHLTFVGQAKELKDEYLERAESVRGRSRVSALPKLDDLSDCLLQGLAWVKWQENRAKLRVLRSSDVSIPSKEHEVFLPWMREQ